MTQDKEYSNEALDILGNIPNSFIRYGLSVFFVILTVIIVFLYLTEYPDVYQVRVKIVSVERDGHTDYAAYGEVPVKDIGKIERNKPLPISLDRFPAYQYGTVTGQVDSISKPVTSISYIICIRLPEGLCSTLGKELEYFPEAEGVAEFKGKPRSFIQRIFSSSVETD